MITIRCKNVSTEAAYFL